MRAFIILFLALFLVACAAEQGKGMYGALSKASREQTAAITGQVIGNVYNDRTCFDDGDCGPSQVCVNQTCVVKS